MFLDIKGQPPKGMTRSGASPVALILGVFLFILSANSYAALHSGLAADGLIPLSEEELAGVTGQALFLSNKIVGNNGSNGSSGLTFYNAGLDARLSLNLNIKNLELGRTGPGARDVDIWAENVAFGCTANAAGQCVPSNVATQLRDFVLTRPFIQFAIENDNSPFRQVVGIRLGAEGAEGPLSIGDFKVFSGYLNATANFVMEAQGRNPNGSNNPNADVAITCGASTGPCRGGHNHNTGVNSFGLDGIRSLGLNNDQACVIGICAAFRDLTVNFGEVRRTNRSVVASGSRIDQAFVYGANLESAVEEMVNSLGIGRSNSSLPAGLIDFIFPIVAPQAKDKIKGQLYTALGLNLTHGNWSNTAAQRNALENHALPYNVSNLHRVEVNSPLFGLSFQGRQIRYPGYAADVSSGWAMYLPDAFTLNVSAPAAQFVQNIMSGDARQGNIIGLEPVYDNCWGSATFC